MNHYPNIDILLATYNGERFIEEQIQSLLDQTYSYWRLIIRDDGSTDNTSAIVRNYSKKFPEKIMIIEDGLANLGACRNFAKLMEYSTADYVMFCDQDDVWLPQKMELTYEKMKTMEERYGHHVPLLVYTDMKVVDENLRVISDSYWKHQACNPKNGQLLSRLLVSNVVIGCTMMFNKKLRELCVPLPQEALMHDWWLGLVSAALGKNDFIQEPTVLYRQHKSNIAGARWSMSFQAIAEQITNIKKHKNFLLTTQEQAEAFSARYKNQLDKQASQKISIYSRLNKMNGIKKRYYIVKYQFWWAGFLRNTAFFFII